MNNTSIKSSFPKVYDGVVEIDKLSESEQKIFDEFKTNLTDLIANQWILTATDEGLTQYENAFNIASSPQDTIEFRRERLINRLSAAAPYTYRHLIQRLQSFLGVEDPIVIIEPNQYQILFQVSVGEYGKLDELIKTLIQILPANLTRIVNNFVPAESVTTYSIGQVVDTVIQYNITD